MAGDRQRGRMAPILSAKALSVNKSTGDDKVAAVETLSASRKLIADIVNSSGGRVINSPDDGILAEFDSTVGAVRAANAAQVQLAAHHAELPENRRVRFRIGIDLGEVLVENGRVRGEGIDIATHLEAMAEPGGICISGNVHAEVFRMLDLQFDDLGECRLPNIAQAVRVYAVRRVGAAPVTRRAARKTKATASSAPRLSLVVLPFANLSGDPEQEYFADGLTEDLTTELSRLPGAFVIARSTAFTFKNKPIDVKQLGRELAVRYALEGSVRRSGDQMRVNAQLIETESNAHIWAHRFDTRVSKLFELQDEVTDKIARALNVELVHAESRRVEAERSPIPDAHDLTMRGWSLLYQPHTPSSLVDARQFFEGALAIDPKYAHALVGIAETNAFEIGMGWAKDPAAQFKACGEASAAALRIAPNFARAHYVQALLHQFQHNYEMALASLDRAIALDRNLAAALAQRGLVLTYLDHPDRALESVQNAIRHSPRDFNISNWLFILAAIHWSSGNYAASIETCREAIVANPNLPQNFLMLASAAANLGRKDEARHALAELARLRPGITLTTLRKEYWAGGAPSFLEKAKRSEALLRELGMPE